jgi:hypothetical protein
VVRVDVPRGGVPTTFALGAAPEALLVDPLGGYLFATETSTAAVARLDLFAGTVTSIPVSNPAAALALGNGGRVFAALTIDNFHHPLAVIDGAPATVLGTLAGDFGDVIAYDRDTDRLISTQVGFCSAWLDRYSFDGGAITMTKEQRVQQAGCTMEALLMSTDMRQLAVIAANDRTGLAVIDDVDPMTFNVNGDWNVGPFPMPGAFSQDGSVLVTSDGFSVFVFDAHTHAKLHTYTMPRCVTNSTWDIDRVSISRGGRIIWAYSRCGPGFTDPPGLLSWVVR